LSEDAFQQGCGRLRPGRSQHLHPGRSALSVGQHGGAGGAADHVEIEGGLVCRREGAVERVGEHCLALGAVLWITRKIGFRAAELVDVRHLNHLPWYTL
jgi:hypothetical protein